MREQPHVPKTRQAPTSSMPFDKQPNGKPFAPTLSSNFRNTRSPLTPRLAGSAPNSPAPSTRRDAFVRTRSPAQEEPAPAALNGNITPRTAARKSRIGTESPATPASNKATIATARPRAVSGSKASLQSQLGLGITSPTGSVNSPSAILQTTTKSPAPAYTVHRRVSGAKSAIQVEDDAASKFFRADDARSYVSERPAAAADPSSFFFIGSPNSQSSLSPKISPSRDPPPNVEEKFFHANDVRPQSSSNPPSRPALPSKISSASTNPARSPCADGTRPNTSASRSGSPNRIRKPETQPNSPQRSIAGKVLSPASMSRQNSERRGSIDGPPINIKAESNAGHRKSMSTTSITTAPQRKPSLPRSNIIPPLDQLLADPVYPYTASLDRSTLPARTTDSYSPKQIPTNITTAPREDLIPENQKAVASPVLDPTTVSPNSETFSDPSQESSAKPSDAAANARRERKVLDLEISNSSLLAINKTLERELRKQNIELRRFRRLSRSGRLSLVPTNRSVSGSTLDTVAEGDGEDIELSEPDDDSDLDTIDDEDVLSNDSSSVHSPTSRARQRARDEKRLMLDLSKHQQMLLDSQKLTQSIRRCLTCTEELIREGNKALEYKVGIGDVQLGGRVLNHEELDYKLSDNSREESPQRHGLLSPSVTLAQLEEAALWLANGIGSPQPVDGAQEGVDGDLGALQSRTSLVN